MEELKNKHWWELNIHEVCSSLQTDIHHGLSDSVASKRLEEVGLNKLPDTSSISVLYLFLHQFSNFIIWVLIVAAIIAGFLQEWMDTLAISIILIFNSIIGFIQEYRAEKSLEALKKLSKPTAKITREGKLKTLPATQIVPGDLVLLEAGDRIPADGRIIESSQLTTQEAALTGESTAVQKVTKKLTKSQLAIGDRKNMVFMGTVVVNGKGHMIATGTGTQTEIGKIATLLQKGTEEQTPLQIRLEKFGKFLVYGCIGIILIVFALGLLRGYPFIELTLTALSLAVAVIPEGLPAIVTIVLAIGVRRMVKRNSLIRRLPSVETLGCTTVICTDKTGTLTQNEMVVTSIWVDQKHIKVTGTGYTPEGDFKHGQEPIKPFQFADLELLLKAVSLCNNANLYKDKKGWQISGDPTEAALLVAAQKFELIKKELEKVYIGEGELPFDSERKCMSVLRKDTVQNQFLLFTKGAVDVILRRSSHILLNEKVLPWTDEFSQSVTQANRDLAKQGLRVLAVAFKEVDNDNVEPSIENELTFIGLIAMQDPPRPEVKTAIQTCKDAGIKTIMITGDHKETALAIAKELGLISKDSIVLDGKEIEALDQNSFVKLIEKIAIYARVSAYHKLKIVRGWKEKGEVVAMTGDGVNDAPAIKEADIGIAMGITGTDVTKEASDMIITDDNFASIVKAVEEGRGLYENIVRFISYLFSTNLAEVLIIFLGMILNLKDEQGVPFLLLLPTQILWINLLSDGFPAVALGLDPIDKNIMKKPPRDPKSPLLPARLIIQLVIISFIVTIATLFAAFWGLKESSKMAQTMTFTTLVVLELVKVQIIRSPYQLSIFSNYWIIITLAISFILLILAVYNPLLQKVFGTIPLGINEWITICVISIVVWTLSQIVNKVFGMKQN